MEEARKFDLRPLLVAAAVAAVIATLWATGAFAAGGSSSQGDSSGNAPPAFVQDEQGPSDRDCPEGRGGREPADPADGSGATDL